MPGFVDSHVHVNEPGRTPWEGFETATKAAASAGITTIVDMPLNSIPPTTTRDNFKVKVDVAKTKSYVDVAFWGGVIPGNKGELKVIFLFSYEADFDFKISVKLKYQSYTFKVIHYFKN